MAITDFASLKAEVQVWAARSDSVFSNRVEQFVAMAEDRLYDGGGTPGEQLYTPPIRSRPMEATATWAMVAGEVALPDGVLDIIRIFPDGGKFGTTALAPERFAEFSANVTGGSATFHTVEAGVLKIAPAYTGDVSVSYFQRFPAITSVAPTGPLLSAHPGIYLSAVLFEAFSFLQDGDLASGHLARLKGLISGANRSALNQRFIGPLKVRPRSVIGG